MDTRYCLECGARIKGRSDKKYCNDQCRNSYNNRQKGDANAFVRRVNHILRRNRSILETLIPPDTGKIRLAQSQLVDKGFNFSYYTHIYKTRNRHTYYFCYEYGYMLLEDDYYMLVKRESRPQDAVLS
ncbi:hypothetical protein [Compostibacter hankyongensis]|uniref:DUF2116 family Zn-ribbon domain-containing protein n=1 Tax=Compostibacter hankyongensis TaxID=1007089 RepID=A0ABP8G2K6_9BACT